MENYNDIEIQEKSKIQEGWDDCVDTNREYLIYPFLTDSPSVCMLYGPPATGKTFVVLDMAFSIASGQKEWHGYEIDKQKKVLYLTKEGRDGLAARKDAWLKSHNLTRNAIEGYYYTSNEKGIQGFKLKTEDDVTTLQNDILSKMKDVGLILFDTFSLFFGGDNENDNTQVETFLSLCNKLAINLRCKVFVIHHARKDEATFRGASTLQGNVSLMLTIQRSENSKGIYVQKNKDGKDEYYLLKYKIMPLTVAHDQKGRPIESCYIEKLSEEEEKIEEKSKEDTREIFEFMEDIKYGRIPVHAIEKEDMHRMYFIAKDEWDEYLIKYEKLTTSKAYNETNPKQKRRARRLCVNRNLFPVQDKKERYKWFILGSPLRGRVWEIPNNWKNSPEDQDYVTSNGELFANRFSLEKEPIDVTSELAKKGYDLKKPIKETSSETLYKAVPTEDEIRSTEEPIDGSLF